MNPRTHILALSLILVAILLTGCRSAIDSRLDSADAVMETQPDSALAILESIDPGNLRGEQRARYAMLFTQARDKNDINVAGDSIISYATDYYSGRDDHNMMRASYLRAVVTYYSRRYQESIYWATIADSLATREGDTLYLSRIASITSFDYNRLKNHPMDLRFSLKNLAMTRPLDDSIQLVIAKRNVVTSLLDAGRYDEALQLANGTDSLNRLYRGIALLETGRTAELDSLLALQPSIAETSRFVRRRARIEAGRGNFALADSLLSLAYRNARNSSDLVNTNMESITVYRLSGRTDKQIAALEREYHNMDSVFSSTMATSVPEVQTLAYRYISDLDSARQHRSRQYLLVLVAILVAVVMILSVVLLIMAKRKADFRGKVALLGSDKPARTTGETAPGEDYYRLKQQLPELSGGSNQNTDIHSVTDDLRLLSRLADLYYLCPTTEEESAIGRRIKRTIRHLSDKEFMTRLEELLNARYDNIIGRLRAQGITRQRDISLATYTVAGLSSNAIAVLLDLTPQNVNTIKYRLNARLTDLKIKKLMTL